MKKLTLDQQQQQNVSLLNTRLSTNMTRTEVLEFCKRAKIDVCCDLIDDEVKDEFLLYYGYLPIYSLNYDHFNMVKI